MEIQGATAMFAVNHKRIITLLKEKIKKINEIGNFMFKIEQEVAYFCLKNR